MLPFFCYFEIFTDKLVAIKSKSSSNIRHHSHHSTKILDSQDFEDVNSQKLYDNINDYDEVNKSADEVSLYFYNISTLYDH